MSEKKIAIVTRESESDRYAVIEARWNEDVTERFVVAYRDRESLRELIAAPSIIGIGFRSHQAAAAVIPNRSSRNAGLNDIREKPGFRRDDDHRGPQSPVQRLRHRLGLAETRRMACTTLQSAVAAGVLMFYSRSLLGSVIRAFVSG